jgi:hypothetical protein
MKTKSQMHVLAVALLLIALFAGGCANVPLASVEDDTRAKTHSVPAGKSVIYVYRNESFGGAIPMTVLLDRRTIGQTGAQTYFMFEVEPGEHEIGSLAENTSFLKLTTVADKAYYVWQEVKMGMWKARSLLQQVDDATGRAGVAESKRAQPSP